MATKKKDEIPFSNVNTNNNTNNVNVHVKVERPRKQPVKKAKPNWIVKAVVLGIIGLVISILTYYINGGFSNENHKPPVIENGTPPILPN